MGGPDPPSGGKAALRCLSHIERSLVESFSTTVVDTHPPIGYDYLTVMDSPYRTPEGRRMCFFCNVDLIPTVAQMNDGYYFCGGEPVCVCAEPDDDSHDHDRLTDDGNPHTDDDTDDVPHSGEDAYEFAQAFAFPSWMVDFYQD